MHVRFAREPAALGEINPALQSKRVLDWRIGDLEPSVQRNELFAALDLQRVFAAREFDAKGVRGNGRMPLDRTCHRDPLLEIGKRGTIRGGTFHEEPFTGGIPQVNPRGDGFSGIGIHDAPAKFGSLRNRGYQPQQDAPTDYSKPP